MNFIVETSEVAEAEMRRAVCCTGTGGLLTASYSLWWMPTMMGKRKPCGFFRFGPLPNTSPKAGGGECPPIEKQDERWLTLLKPV